MKFLFAITLIGIFTIVLWQKKSQKKYVLPKNNYNYKSFVQYPLSAGLPRALFEVNKELKSVKNSNYIYLIIHRPAEFFYNYSIQTIRHLLTQTQKIEFEAGHLQLAWSCHYNGKLMESATGFTGDYKNQSIQLAREGYGMSPLVATYLDGSLESPNTVDNQMVKSLKAGRLTILAINVGPECSNVLENIWTFVNDSNNNFFSHAKLSNRASKGFNCTSLISDWLRPVGPIHRLLKSYSKETFKLSSSLFRNISASTKISNILFPQIPHANQEKITLTTFLKRDDYKNILSVTLYSPATLLKTINWDKFQKKTFEYQGLRGHVHLY